MRGMDGWMEGSYNDRQTDRARRLVYDFILFHVCIYLKVGVHT